MAGNLKPKDRREVNARAVQVLESSREIAINEAAAAAVEVVRQHRARLAELNGLADILTYRLEQMLAKDAKDKLPAFSFNAAEILNRITQSVARLIPLERQAFNLETDEDADYRRGATIFQINYGPPPSNGK